ncbi:MAG: HEPN domain-containing protein [Acidimicrobiales bacterium]
MPVAYEVRADRKALYDKRTLREWMDGAVSDIVAATDPVQIYVFGSVARGEDGPYSDLDILVVFDKIEDNQIGPLMTEARDAITAPVPYDVLVTDLARFEFNKQRLWHIEHQVAKTGILVYEREPRIAKEQYINPPPADDSQDTDLWMKKSRADLTMMSLGMSVNDPDNALYHAQRAAEKSLKALLITEQIEVPATHDLVKLAGALPSRYHNLFDTDALKSLTGWEVEGRYPANIPVVDKDVDKLMGTAKSAVDVTTDLIADIRAGKRQEPEPEIGR